MKTYFIFYRGEQAYLRRKNPLQDQQHLLSVETYRQHEVQYVDEALPLINPVANKTYYDESEVQLIKQVFVEELQLWQDGDGPGTARIVFRAVPTIPKTVGSYQSRVEPWVIATFGEEILHNPMERCMRFIEEAFELVQAVGLPKEDVLRQLIYTYGRPKGDIEQETGAVMLTLACLTSCNGLDLEKVADSELSRVWMAKDLIREKWLNKVAPLPEKTL